MEYDQGGGMMGPAMGDASPPPLGGFGAYEAAALPPSPQTSVMMTPPPTERTRGYGDGPLMDTTQSVTFAVPTQQEQQIFSASPMSAVAPATGPYRSPAPFPVRGTPSRRRSKALGEPPQRTSAMLGLSLLVVGVGVAIGAKYAGLFGGIAGGLYGGASINAMRAVKNLTDGQPESDREAAISGTYAVLGAGVATYVLYQTRAEKKKG